MFKLNPDLKNSIDSNFATTTMNDLNVRTSDIASINNKEKNHSLSFSSKHSISTLVEEVNIKFYQFSYNKINYISYCIFIKNPLLEQNKEHDEYQNQGYVSWKHYYDFITLGLGIIGFLLLFMAFAFGQTLSILTDYYLAMWSSTELSNAQFFNQTNDSTSLRMFHDEFFNQRKSNFIIYSS